MNFNLNETCSFRSRSSDSQKPKKSKRIKVVGLFIGSLLQRE